MKSRAYQTTPTPVLDLLPSLLTTKTNRPLMGLILAALAVEVMAAGLTKLFPALGA